MSRISSVVAVGLFTFLFALSGASLSFQTNHPAGCHHHAPLAPVSSSHQCCVIPFRGTAPATVAAPRIAGVVPLERIDLSGSVLFASYQLPSNVVFVWTSPPAALALRI